MTGLTGIQLGGTIFPKVEARHSREIYDSRLVLDEDMIEWNKEAENGVVSILWPC